MDQANPQKPLFLAILMETFYRSIDLQQIIMLKELVKQPDWLHSQYFHLNIR